MSLKLLVVEDDENDIETCKSTRDRFVEEKNIGVDLVFAKTLVDAKKQIDNSFDGMIIDLRLNGDSTAGNELLDMIRSSFRVPVVAMTGTPDNVARKDFLEIYKKGEVGYDTLFDKFCDIHKTGVTKIFGFRGLIDEQLNKVFWENIFPRIDSWVLHANGERPAEHSLLRCTLNHVVQILDDLHDTCVTDEVYISPPMTARPQTGSIVKTKEDGAYSIVISPACDLALRENGEFKSDRIQLCGIVDMSTITVPLLTGINNESKKAKKIEQLIKNNHTNYLHWLPQFSQFSGGLINFRYVEALRKSDYEMRFETAGLLVSPHFMKDIISRFSAYYARQGQPDLAFAELAKQHVGD